MTIPTNNFLEPAKKTSPQKALTLASFAGELLMKNGAETFRVEDTMVHIMKSCGYMDVEAYATPTGIFASIFSKDQEVTTSIKRINQLTNNFNVLLEVNQLSRSFSQGLLTPLEVEEALLAIQRATPPYKRFTRALWCGIACACFAWLLEGGILDALNAFLVGLMIQSVLQRTSFLPSILQSLLGGFLIATMAHILIFLGLGENINSIVIGSLMPLLPGITFINSIRDFMVGDYISGSTRMSDALLLAICLATGIAVTLSFWSRVF